MKIINYTPDLQFSFPTIVTVGMFDGVHVGHQAILSFLKKQGDNNPQCKTVVITFDSHPRAVLGLDADKLKMLSSQEEKFEQIANQGIDNLLLIPFTKELASLSAAEFVKTILLNQCRIQTLVLGYDNHFGNKQKGNFSEVFSLAENGLFNIETVEACYCENIEISSTQVRKLLGSGNISMANKMLGKSYSFSAKVIPGKQIGHTLGFPTANLQLLDSSKLIPQEGVYAVKIRYNEQLYNGMMSIGKQLTFGFDDTLVEVHIFNLNETLYDKVLTIFFEEKIRDVRKFSGKEELIAALENDKQKCLKILTSKS